MIIYSYNNAKVCANSFDESNLQGVAINIPPEDNFRGKLIELRDIGLKWANLTNKVRGLEMTSEKSKSMSIPGM